MKWLDVILVFAILFVAFFGFRQYYIGMHESVHMLNCERFGGEPTTEYGFEGGMTHCHGLDLTPEEELVWLQNDIQNEIVGYHGHSIFLSMWACTAILILTVVLNNMRRWWE